MTKHIYTSSSDGRLEPLEETLFPTEDELQALYSPWLKANTVETCM